MKLIVGLGNPTDEYKYTRHNTGFLAMDIIANKLGCDISKSEFKALTGKTRYKGEQVILMKPMTYMNSSGEAVSEIVNYYHLDIKKDVLIIYDDLDLNYGQIRLREKGSAGGHNGIKSIINLCQSDQFCRIRIGIQKNPNIPVVDYVLGHVEKEYQTTYNSALALAADAAIEAITEPFQVVMNKYNQKVK